MHGCHCEIRRYFSGTFSYAVHQKSLDDVTFSQLNYVACDSTITNLRFVLLVVEKEIGAREIVADLSVADICAVTRIYKQIYVKRGRIID